MNDELRGYLNRLDIEEFLEHDRSVEDIMDEIEAIYGDDFSALYGGWMFDDCGQEDFADYIRAEYGTRCYERTLLFVR